MNDTNTTTTSKKTWSFYFAILLMVVLAFLSLNTDFAHLSADENVPTWFYYLLFSVDFLVFSSIVLIYFYKNIGVFLLPISVITHYIFHNYYLSTTLYSDLHLLFVFISAGLLVIIPRWNFFR